MGYRPTSQINIFCCLNLTKAVLHAPEAPDSGISLVAHRAADTGHRDTQHALGSYPNGSCATPHIAPVTEHSSTR